MLQIKLSTLAILLGLAVILLNIYGVLKPSAFAAAARKFPRWTPVGYVLTLLSTIWFVANVSHEPIADFASFKNVSCTTSSMSCACPSRRRAVAYTSR